MYLVNFWTIITGYFYKIYIKSPKLQLNILDIVFTGLI